MTTQTIKFHMKPETFKQNAAISLQDKPLRKSLRTAMDMLMTKRKASLSDEEELQNLRDLCEHVRQRSLSKLPALLEQLEENLTKLGVKVHWAENAGRSLRNHPRHHYCQKRQADGQRQIDGQRGNRAEPLS